MRSRSVPRCKKWGATKAMVACIESIDEGAFSRHCPGRDEGFAHNSI